MGNARWLGSVAMSAADEGETSFEEMYASAGEDLQVIPGALSGRAVKA